MLHSRDYVCSNAIRRTWTRCVLLTPWKRKIQHEIWFFRNKFEWGCFLHFPKCLQSPLIPCKESRKRFRSFPTHFRFSLASRRWKRIFPEKWIKNTKIALKFRALRILQLVSLSSIIQCFYQPPYVDFTRKSREATIKKKLWWVLALFASWSKNNFTWRGSAAYMSITIHDISESESRTTHDARHFWILKSESWFDDLNMQELSAMDKKRLFVGCAMTQPFAKQDELSPFRNVSPLSSSYTRRFHPFIVGFQLSDDKCTFSPGIRPIHSTPYISEHHKWFYLCLLCIRKRNYYLSFIKWVLNGNGSIFLRPFCYFSGIR